MRPTWQPGEAPLAIPRGGTVRFVVEHDGHYSGVWKVWSARNSQDLYLAIRVAGAFKVSFHESGSWQAGFTQPASHALPESMSRHMEIWQRPERGITRAYGIVVPSRELRTSSGGFDSKVTKLPWAGEDKALWIHVALLSPNVICPDAFSILDLGDGHSAALIVEPGEWNQHRQVVEDSRDKGLAAARASGWETSRNSSDGPVQQDRRHADPTRH